VAGHDFVASRRAGRTGIVPLADPPRCAHVAIASYKFRLIFASTSPGIMNWESDSHPWHLPSNRAATLVARPSGPLATAAEFHIDAGGFETAAAARDEGERLRSALRLANAVLGLSLRVPTATEEMPRARLAPQVKEQIAQEHGVNVVDCVFGLNVLEESSEFEFVVKGDLSARPKDSSFVFEAAGQLWGYGDKLDDVSMRATELLNSAARDPSLKSSFLIVFLAFDLLMARRKRPEAAQDVLAALRQVVDDSELQEQEKARLRSYLGAWTKTSLGAEIEEFVAAGSNRDIEVRGKPLAEFLRDCVKMRGKIAHPIHSEGSCSEEVLRNCREGLRQVVLGIVWARNRLPPIEIERPGDLVQIDGMTVTFL